MSRCSWTTPNSCSSRSCPAGATSPPFPPAAGVTSAPSPAPVPKILQQRKKLHQCSSKKYLMPNGKTLPQRLWWDLKTPVTVCKATAAIWLRFALFHITISLLSMHGYERKIEPFNTQPQKTPVTRSFRHTNTKMTKVKVTCAGVHVFQKIPINYPPPWYHIYGHILRSEGFLWTLICSGETIAL